MQQPIRIGLIGAGRWGKVYLKTLQGFQSRCRLTHLATSRPENATRAGAPVATVTDWRELVAACDAVIVATPPQLHAEMLEACLDAGKPCLMEKPLCLDVPTAERLHQRVSASGIPVLVDHTQLFHPAYHAMKVSLAQSGEPVRLVQSEGLALGPFRSHSSALWDWAPHDVSLCLDLIGGYPGRIDALGCAVAGTETPDMVCLRLMFARQVPAWIHAGRLSPAKRRRLVVFTDRHLYELDDLAEESLTVSSIDFARRETDGLPREPERRPVPHDSRAPLEAVIDHFLDGLAGGGRAHFGTRLALDVVRVLAECERALARG